MSGEDHTARTYQYECLDCPEDSALLGFKMRSTAEKHAERTGHEVVEVDNVR